jgi:gamma-glutamyltranspeptidase/glutathione hydrolase
MNRAFNFKTIITLMITSAATLSANTHSAPQQSDMLEPESAMGKNALVQNAIAQTKQLEASKHMVVSANPYASNAALEVLRNGGNASDAMVTVQTVLGLVEPQSSGLGGGAFTLYFDAKKQKLTAYDGRETAPMDVTQDLFLAKDQTPLGFFEAVVGGRSVGTPGTVALLGHIHGKYGSKPWGELLEPAIKLAEQGFQVSPRLANAIATDRERLSTDADSRDYFLPNGEPLAQGMIVKNQAYADVLRMLAAEGPKAFYTKRFAQTIVAKVQSSANKGYLSVDDFTRYEVVEREPVCAPFLRYRVCGMGPPSSGAVSVGQILMMTEAANTSDYPTESADAWQVISDATRLSFADRNTYLADPDFFDVPGWLLNENYIQQRAALLTVGKPLTQVAPGTFQNNAQSSVVEGIQIEQASTTHFSIVDSQGNVLSSTSTIENGFGSRLMVNGFLLNNELTDFSFSYENEQGLIANRVQAAKRPRSSMAPTIVMETGAPKMAIGSPGGSRIINYVANSLIRTLMWNQHPYNAINAAHISNRYGQMDVEKLKFDGELVARFKQMGYETQERDLNSGLHVIKIDKANARLIGAADERREGHVAGD